MLTFQDQYKMAQDITGDHTSAGLVLLKRDINEGGAVFLNRLGRKFNKQYKTANLEPNQQYYQFSADVLRISKVRVLHGTFWYTPELITSEEEWDRLNAIVISGNYPLQYYIRGFNEVGLRPQPSSEVLNGLEISFEPQHIELTQDDFISGTVTVNKGIILITHSGTGFTPQMVGRWLQITDGTDGRWYRIASYVSSSQVNLENFFEGLSGSHAFRIGEVMKIPQGYQDAPVYYACERNYITLNDQRTSPIFHQRFEDKLTICKETYGRSTSQMGVKSQNRMRRARWIDLTPPVTYP